jgi:hypothetical protein
MLLAAALAIQIPFVPHARRVWAPTPWPLAVALLVAQQMVWCAAAKICSMEMPVLVHAHHARPVTANTPTQFTNAPLKPRVSVTKPITVMAQHAPPARNAAKAGTGNQNAVDNMTVCVPPAQNALKASTSRFFATRGRQGSALTRSWQ